MDRAFFIDGWLVSPLEGTLRRGEDVTRLEPRAMEVLVYLASRPHEVVAREELERDVWRGALVGYDAVTATVIKLRKALQDDARQPRCIKTVPKRGYQLVAPVSYPTDEESGESTPPGIADFEATQTEAQHEPPAQTRRQYRTLMATLAALLVLGLLGLTSVFSPESNDSGEPGDSSARPSIAVLPFEHLGTDTQEDLLADGITEDIITDLSRLSNLQVIAGSTSSRYKGTSLEPIQIGTELNVRFILKGSIRRVLDAIRVNVRLIDVDTGFNAWAQRYDRKLTEVFAVQNDLTRQIVESLAVEMSNEERQRLAHRATDNLKAYGLFQEAQRLFKMRTRSANKQAGEIYRQAIRADPGYGRAYGALAVTLVTEYRDGWTDSPAETLDRALELAEKAVALDDSAPQTHWALGFVYLFRKEFTRAKEAARRAVTIAPNYADGYGLLALISNYLGDAKKAIALLDKAVLLNPYYTSEYLLQYGLAYYTLGDHESAVSTLEAAYERNANFAFIKLWLAATYVQLGQRDEAEWLLTELRMSDPHVTLSHVQRAWPIADEALRRRFLNDLRAAGLPE